MQTLQQKRAKHALGKVKALIPLNDAAKLKARASELPFMIHSNGLGQAAAFFKSKGNKDGYDHVYALLNAWLTQPERPLSGNEDILNAITQADLHTYRMAQTEAMQYMRWIKQFAGTYLQTEG